MTLKGINHLKQNLGMFHQKIETLTCTLILKLVKRYHPSITYLINLVFVCTELFNYPIAKTKNNLKCIAETGKRWNYPNTKIKKYLFQKYSTPLLGLWATPTAMSVHLNDSSAHRRSDLAPCLPLTNQSPTVEPLWA